MATCNLDQWAMEFEGNLQRIKLSIQQAKEVLLQKQSFTRGYKLRKDQIANLGMICGGDVMIYFQYISYSNQSFYQLCIFIQALFACAMSAFRYNQSGPPGHFRSRDCMLASPSNIHSQSSKAVSHANSLSQAEQIP